MIQQFRQDILNKKKSALEIAKEYLKKAKALNKKYNSFISFCDDLALQTAKRIDIKLKEGRPLGKLAGVPIGVKDNILVKGYVASAACAMLKNYTASFDADVVTFLLKEDALLIGKTNMDEFAMGSSSETSAYGRVKHHQDSSLVPGGSSGGSAVAVASGQVVAALGSDTGGSIRQPASFTGTIGLKPTYGKVSRYGLIAMASSLDQIGIFVQDINDVKTLLEVISQPTSFDSTYVPKDFQNSENPHLPDNATPLAQYTIGVPEQYFTKGLDAKIKKAIDALLTNIEQSGAKIVSLSMPSLEYALACYYIIMPAEASSNLARYDGMRYGAPQGSKSTAQQFDTRYSLTRANGFGSEVKRRIILGAYVLSAGYIDKYYLKAQQVRATMLAEFEEAFAKVDIILGPTSPIFPFTAGTKLDDPVAMYLSDIYTVAPNLAGLPAISLPLQATPLPAGVQLIAPQFAEGKLFEAALAIQPLL